MSSDQPAWDAIELRMTPTQKGHYFRRTGMLLNSISLNPAQLKRLSVVAAKAGAESLPVSRSAVRQLLEPEPPGTRGGGPFVVEVALTPAQKEQIRRATGKPFASLRIGPHDFPVAYRETWDDAATVRAGRTLVIRPAGGSHEASRTDRVVELPAGGGGSGRGVFGTGRHPATQLALVLLEEHVRPGDRVLDLGTGSGILAVAAARLGAGEVLALDVEADAVAVARETVALNGLAGAVEVVRGGVGSAAPPYDVVAANIFPNVLAELASSLAAAVRGGGVLVASGSVAARAAEAIDAVSAAGLGLEGRHSQDGWVGMVFRKP